MSPPTVPETGGDDSALRVTRSVVIPASELRWRFSASGGPGGQHANTSNTRADVSFDVEASTALGPVQRARILERLGPLVSATASDERSQLRNRSLARERLRDKLAAALHVEKARRATKPSRGATQRRLDDKSRQSQRKSERRARPDGD